MKTLIIPQIVWMWLIINILIDKTVPKPILPELIGGVANLASGLLGGFNNSLAPQHQSLFASPQQSFFPPPRQSFFQTPGISAISAPLLPNSGGQSFSPPGLGAQFGQQAQTIPVYGLTFPPPQNFGFASTPAAPVPTIPGQGAQGAQGPLQQGVYIMYTPKETGLLSGISGVINSAVNTVFGLAGAAGNMVSLLGGVFGGALGGGAGGAGGAGGYNAVPVYLVPAGQSGQPAGQGTAPGTPPVPGGTTPPASTGGTTPPTTPPADGAPPPGGP